MNKIYYVLLASSSLFLIYTILNVLLTVKFINKLPKILESKYLEIIKFSRITLTISFVLFLIVFIIPINIIKFLLLIVTMILNSYSLSEIFNLKEFI